MEITIELRRMMDGSIISTLTMPIDAGGEIAWNPTLKVIIPKDGIWVMTDIPELQVRARLR